MNTNNDIIYSCLFCGDGIQSGILDPCALQVIAKIDSERDVQKEQTFYCHINCLIQHSAINNGSFYICETNFPTISEIENDAKQFPTEEQEKM